MALASDTHLVGLFLLLIKKKKIGVFFIVLFVLGMELIWRKFSLRLTCCLCFICIYSVSIVNVSENVLRSSQDMFFFFLRDFAFFDVSHPMSLL